MSDKYGWRDGWALTFPRALPIKPVLITKEKISRCEVDGNYIYDNQPCFICKLLNERVK